MAVQYGFSHPPAYIEEFQRNLLQGAYDKTKDADPAGIAKQGITGFQPLQTGAITGTAGLYGIDPKTGLPTGTGAAFDPYFAQAQQDIGTAKTTTGMGIPSLQAAQGQYDPSTSNYQQFFNQYQADVTKEALKQMDEQAALQKNQLQDQAQQAGAFGGSRMAVQEAELDKNILDIKSRRIFQDLAQNFSQAQDKAIGTFESGRARDMSAAGMLPQMGAQQFGLANQGLGQLFNFGAGRQAFEQGKLDDMFRVAEAKRLEPYNRLSYFGDVLAGVPSVSQTLTQKPLPYTNPFLGGIGAAMSAYGLMNQQS